MSRIPLPRAIASGPLTYREARAAGVGEGRLRGPDLARPFRGVRSLESPLPLANDYDNDLPLVLRRCAEYAPLLLPGQYFSHVTAAVLWRIPLPRRLTAQDPIHVTSTAPRNAPRAAGVIGHRSPRAPIFTRFGFPVSSPEATWLAIASLFPVDDLIAAGDALVLDPEVLDPRDIRPYSTIDRLERNLVSFTGRGKRAAVEAHPQIRQGAESSPETKLRLFVIRANFPEPELQVKILDATGKFLGRADQYFREYRTILEYDGEHHRKNSVQYARDLGRIQDLRDEGYGYVRVTMDGLFVRPDQTLARITRALSARGWKG